MTDTREEREEERLVRAQGDAYAASYRKLMDEDSHAEVEADDYRITVSCEPAEGMYVPDGEDAAAWRVPERSENQHFEVIVRDRLDGRFIPGLSVTLRMTDADGGIVADTDVPFVWHPFVLHYGVNGAIPGEGDYAAEVRIRAARFPRHDEVRGRRYQREVVAHLGPLHLKPGTKPHGPE